MIASAVTDDIWRWGLVPVTVLWAALSFTLVSSRLPPWFKAGLASANAVLTLSIPYLVPYPWPPLEPILRADSGYLAMKIMDICVARAYHPPKLLSLDGRHPSTPSERLKYTYRLCKETRYESFDISVVQPPSSTPQSLSSNATYYLVASTIILLLNHILPIAEVKVLVMLLSLELSFSLLHPILRPSSHAPLFDTPLLSPTLASFWRKRWHAMVVSPVTTLAFDPASKLGGRAAGVLAAFALSGLWHAWALVPLAGPKTAWRLWIVFVMQGVGCLLEYALWGKQKTLARRGCIWAWSLTWAGWALRGWRERSLYGL